MQGISRSLGLISRGLIALAVAAGLAITGLIGLAVVMRYLVGAPLRLTEETVGLLFVTLVFLPLPYLALREQHIAATVVVERLPRTWQRVIAAGSRLLVLVFVLWFGAVTWDFAQFSWEVGARSDAANIPIFPFMALMPVALGLTGLAAALALALGRAPVTPSEPGPQA